MKLCNICKQPMDADVAFANLHNICRTCLESGQDTQCLNNPNIKLSEWEQQHIKQCTKCSKHFVATWHLGTQCGVCAKPIREKQRIKDLALQLRDICSEVEVMCAKYVRCQRYIKYKEKQIRREERIIQSPFLVKKDEHKAKKRIEGFFGDNLPFDVETLCQVMSIKKGRHNNLLPQEIYDVLAQFFIDGYSQTAIADMHNLSVLSVMTLIYRSCFIVSRPKYDWLFQPVQRRPKEVKEQELKDRIADIEESQSRIDLTEPKE